MSRASVLLADDHEAFLEVEARLLEPEFEVVETVRDGRAAVEAAARLAPDVLVLDISMPVLDGIEAVRSLRAAGSRSKFVFLTVHGDEDYVRAALAAGAVGIRRQVPARIRPPSRLEGSTGRSSVHFPVPQPGMSDF